MAASLNEMAKCGKTFPADQVDALGATIEEGKRSLEDALKVQDTPIKQVLLDCGVFEEDKETHVVQLSKAATEFFALASGRVQSQVESRNNSAVAKLRKIVASTNMLLAQVSVADEKEFRKKMQGSAGSKVATNQKDFTNALAEAASIDPEKKAEDHAQLMKDAAAAKGTCMFYVAFFAALVFYRSPSMGIKSAEGTATNKRLVMTLTSVSADADAAKCERDLDIPLMKEIRVAACRLVLQTLGKHVHT